MKKLIPFVIAVLIAYFLQEQFDQTQSESEPAGESRSVTSRTEEALRSGAQIQGSGTVSRILQDDNDGSRHQRFIIRLSSGRTLLIAHNIDVAPRISGLRVGDTVGFNGVFEANDKGGVIHWTHHDPEGRHEAGWLKHDGRTYQ